MVDSSDRGRKSSLERLSQDQAVIAASDALRQAASLQDLEATHRQSLEDNEGFWAGVANELEWFRTWDKVFEQDYPRFKWFLGGQCNITVNALDRHANSWRRNKVALIWVGEDGREVTVTYGQLLRRVNKVANGLKALGVGKGDRVIIYMPLTMEGITAMLACARIGAIHSVVYAGFSSGALRSRIVDAQAKVVMASDVTYRRGNTVNLKSITDEAVGGLDFVEKVIIHRRQDPACELRPDQEIDFDDLRVVGIRVAINRLDRPLRPAHQKVRDHIVIGHDPGTGAHLDGHVTDGGAGVHRQAAYARAGKFCDAFGTATGTHDADNVQNNIFREDAFGQGASQLKLDRFRHHEIVQMPGCHGVQTIRRADTKGQGAQGAVGIGV